MEFSDFIFSVSHKLGYQNSSDIAPKMGVILIRQKNDVKFMSSRDWA